MQLLQDFCLVFHVVIHIVAVVLAQLARMKDLSVYTEYMFIHILATATQRL
jgi:hypothetical protein